MSNLKEGIYRYAKELMEIDSPSGFCQQVVKYLENFAIEKEFNYKVSNKGNLNIYLDNQEDKPYTQFCSHVDTLGLMVRSINADGTLRVTPIGGPIASSLYGEYATIYTRNGKKFSGTILVDTPSIHVFPDYDKKIDFDNLQVRLDEKVRSKEDVLQLGINTGDFICYEPKFQIINDFIKSRFLDDKIVAAVFLKLLEDIKAENLTINKNFIFAFSTYEEVGHGMANVDSKVDTLYAVDMGCVGLDLTGYEQALSICPKDSSGPYDYELTTKLIDDAKELGLNYEIDIYPRYGSDASAALRAGNEIRAALFGPGVAASHGMERTHYEALESLYKIMKKMVTEKEK